MSFVPAGRRARTVVMAIAVSSAVQLIHLEFAAEVTVSILRTGGPLVAEAFSASGDSFSYLGNELEFHINNIFI